MSTKNPLAEALLTELKRRMKRYLVVAWKGAAFGEPVVPVVTTSFMSIEINKSFYSTIHNVIAATTAAINLPRALPLSFATPFATSCTVPVHQTIIIATAHLPVASRTL